MALEDAATVTDFAAALRPAFGADRVRAHVPLAPFTTFRVGGPADWLIETRSSDEIVAALALAHAPRRAGDDARRRIERAGRRCRRARPGDPPARRRGARRSTTATFAPMRR